MAELGRWISRDPLGEKGGINLSNFIRNDSINSSDYLGLVDPEFGGMFNVSLGWGRNGLFVSSISFAGSASQGLCENLKIKGDFNIRFYTGDELGTPVGGKGFGYDITGTISTMVGEGAADPIPSYSLNYHTKSAINNSYMNSFNYGRSFNYNSNVGSTKNGFIGVRTDNYYIHYNNDAKEFPTYGNSDYAWTAGAIIGIYAGGGEYAELGYQDFTGRYIDRELTENINGRVHYQQEQDQRGLNKARWYTRYGNVNSGSITANVESTEWLNGQHIIHDIRGFSRFLYEEEQDDEINITVSIEGIVKGKGNID